MLAILLIVLDICVSVLGIYVFDYSVDGEINNVFVIVLSLIGGLVITVLLLGLLIQVFYMVLSDKKLHRSRFSQILAKQLVGVPIIYSGIRIKVVGKENLPKDPGFSIYSNHTSWMDLPFFMYKLYDYPVASLGKEEVFAIPMIGRFAPKFGSIMIDRSSARKGAESIIKVIQRVKDGFTMVIFPEGTRNKDVTSLLDFKQGSFKVALKSGKPLVPVTIVKQKNFRSIRWPFIKRVTLVIHEPIEYEEYGVMRTQELSQKVKDIIESSLLK